MWCSRKGRRRDEGHGRRKGGSRMERSKEGAAEEVKRIQRRRRRTR